MPRPAQYDTPPNIFRGSFCFHLTDLTVGTGDIITNFVPGFPGWIVRTYAIVTTAITSVGTTSQAYNLEIGTVNLVGGVVTINTNGAVGVVYNGTAVVGGNHFDKDDTISLEEVETTAATAGTVTFVIEYAGRIMRRE